MPDDSTPHGGEALHQPPDRAQIPGPKPGQPSDEPVRGQPGDPAQRPELPQEPKRMVADIENEDADPVIDTGPGIEDATGMPSVTRQPA